MLITGCTGFLGSWLSNSLVKAEAIVIGLVRGGNLVNSHLFRLGCQKQMNLVYGRVEDFKTLLRVMSEHEVDTVFHLAAQAIVGKASQDSLATFETNIKGTWNVLEAARRTPSVKRVLVASSDKVYGTCDVLPCVETTPLQAIYPYDVSKSCVEHLCACYVHSFNLPVSITRCGNVFGGGDLNYNRLIPGTIYSLFKGNSPVIRSEGSSIRDYLYVEDGVEAYLCLAEKMEELKLSGEAFNFSLGSPVSAKQLVQQIIELMDSQLKPVILSETSKEIQNMFLSSQKAKKILGWQPKHSLDQGLRKTIQWYREFLS
ncbi:GDP-mannose 4,6-dehydratase [Effusibacillus consociatus]|uniref:GDP-mannose 4,6-dehydratase n=1 Tax=Effusibacillus consociatus TaxID=1117041 RepID=A0ABV9PVY3_9BACL